MTKKLILFCCSVFILSISNGQIHKLEGEWYNEEKDAIITIKKEKDKSYSGYITWMKHPNDENGKPKSDPLNPNEDLRNRKRLGMKIMYNFEYVEDNEWDNGRIYDPKSGNTYRGTITMTSINRLDLRGYVGISWFGRTSYWNRKLNSN